MAWYPYSTSLAVNKRLTTNLFLAPDARPKLISKLFSVPAKTACHVCGSAISFMKFMSQIIYITTKSIKRPICHGPPSDSYTKVHQCIKYFFYVLVRLYMQICARCTRGGSRVNLTVAKFNPGPAPRNILQIKVAGNPI